MLRQAKKYPPSCPKRSPMTDVGDREVPSFEVSMVLSMRYISLHVGVGVCERIETTRDSSSVCTYFTVPVRTCTCI